MRGHAKKVILMKWHPTAEFTLASMGMEGAIKIWDVQSESSKINYDQVTGSPWVMRWNHDGSMLGCITKEKKMTVLDPRNTESAMVTQAHEGSKRQSMAWIGSTNQIITHGWSSYNERQYAVYDTRNFDTPITVKKLDTNTQQAWIHYDESTRVLFTVNKGHPVTHMHFLHESGPEGTPVL